VRKVFPYANRSRWSSSSVKEFSVIVEIENPPPGLRTGSSAEVRIRANQSPDELMVPVQAVLEHNGKHYCLWKGAEGWTARPVQLGYSNDSFVVINEGLTETDQVVLNPRSYLDDLDLPELKGKEIEAQEMLVGVPTLNSATAASTANATPTSSSPPLGGEDARPGGGDRVASMLQFMDKDGDGKISQSEASERMQPRFATYDKNADGFLDAAELAAMPRPTRPRGEEGAPGGGPIPGGAQ
jgi:hypothetical protein